MTIMSDPPSGGVGMGPDSDPTAPGKVSTPNGRARA